MRLPAPRIPAKRRDVLPLRALEIPLLVEQHAQVDGPLGRVRQHAAHRLEHGAGLRHAAARLQRVAQVGPRDGVRFRDRGGMPEERDRIAPQARLYVGPCGQDGGCGNGRGEGRRAPDPRALDEGPDGPDRRDQHPDHGEIREAIGHPGPEPGPQDPGRRRERDEEPDPPHGWSEREAAARDEEDARDYGEPCCRSGGEPERDRERLRIVRREPGRPGDLLDVPPAGSERVRDAGAEGDARCAHVHLPDDHDRDDREGDREERELLNDEPPGRSRDGAPVRPLRARPAGPP